MKEEKKIDFVFDLNNHLKNEIKNSKYIKYGATVLLAIGGILVIGFATKVVSYTIINIKNLKQNLKQ